MTKSQYDKLKNARIKDFTRALENDGYILKRQESSHMIYCKANAAPLSVPCHKNIAPGTWRNLSRLINFD
jgi:predicted RNA binding protein YcfA (HicA-like mRNA interferase family)